MARELVFETVGEEETEALAERLGALLAPPALVALDGELGAGKTAFVRGLARGLGVQGGVSSPTYALMASHEGRVPFLHFDAWMEGRERAFLADGGAELLADAVCAVEWASRVDDALPAARVQVQIECLAPELRRIVLRAVGGDPRLEAALAGLGPLSGRAT